MNINYPQWQFNNNADTFGVQFAATQARRRGVTLESCLILLLRYK